MALTPEDVVNKRFQPTKFREGYDQDEVDDFLDEVVAELRRLTQENDELRQRLARHEDGSGSDTGGTSIRRATTDEAAATGTDATGSDATVGSTAHSETTTGTESTDAPLGGGTAPGATDGTATDDATSTGAATGTHPTDTDAADTGADTAVPATAASPTTASAGATPAADNAAGLLAMAQRIHDEYVNSGIEQRDSIIAEAQTRAETMVTDAETHRTKTLADLEQQKSALQTQVDELRGFERDYRSRLKDYIESQLHDLETTGSVEHRPDAV